MSMRIPVEPLNGETFELEVTADMTMGAANEQLKSMHTWEDELSRDTTVVESTTVVSRLSSSSHV